MIVISEKDIVEEKERMRLQFSAQHKIQCWARNMIQGNYRERGESQVKKLLAALELRAEIGDNAKVPIPGLAPEGLAILVLAGTDVILPPGVRVSRKGRKVTVIYKGKSAVFLLPKHLVNDHENQENGNKGKKKGVNNKR